MNIIEMNISKFLVIAGMWNITDGWFSLSLYWNTNQTFWKDHYIRVIRIIIGIILIWIA